MNPELSYATKVGIHTAVVKLSSSQWKKIERLMNEWEMDFSDFCKYAVVQIADAHQSKRKDAVK